ncbi:MAG: winged helix DNA-binding protein [Kofleriaceae bacterium]
MTELPDAASDLADISFLGRLSERLSALLEEQTQVVFAQHGVVVPVRSCSLLTVFARVDSATAADLARTLDQSHQLIMQKLPKLVRLGLLVQGRDATDSRRKVFRLTAAGRAQLDQLARCRTLIARAYRDLAEEVGELHVQLLRTTDALRARPLHERVAAPSPVTPQAGPAPRRAGRRTTRRSLTGQR